MQKLVHSGTVETNGNQMKIESGGAVAIQVTGAGVYTLTPEVTLEAPDEWDAVWVACKPFDLVGQAVVTAFTAPGIAYIDIPAFGGFRLRQTAGAGTPTSWINELLDT